MKYTEINLEIGMPPAADAMRYLQDAISRLKREKYGCVLIIHGYGSTGEGGVIKRKARSWLNAQVRNGTLKTVINGEDFGIFNFKALELKNKCRELEEFLDAGNEGVTVVEL